ncbi:PAS domain-containing sensor histidine kinase [Streptomyces sp. RPA4-5]|uniref:PAS domain-containing protein n=1 Tax=Streptomyces sp. RPA4-5 TaxID=2721245 RepID=UPI002494D523|nr:PAS domain-containing sensor histidine kinase [Streptomyces sp. RPA4-5]
MSSRPSRGAARLAAILDALPDALLLVNCNGTVVNANTIALETFEAPGTALVGRGLLDLLPSFDSKRIPGSMRRLDEEEERTRTKPTRMVARRTDGTELLVEVTSANLEDGRTPYESAFEAAYADHRNGYTGNELLMLVVRDLTGTLDTETELARQQRQTEMILRAAAEGVVGVDADGKVVLVNPSAAQILGYRASELGGKELHPLIHHSRADGSALPWEDTPLADTLKSGRKHRVRGQALWAKDGRAVSVDLTTAPVRDGDQLVGAVMTFTDRRAFDSLAARHTQLLAVLDQALRGPLEELKGELGTLASDPAGQLWPEANQILHHLAAGHARMTTLVDNVLSYQRLDSGKEKLNRTKVSLDGVVAAGVEGAIELIGPGRAQFAVHAPPIEATVDAERIAQALSHLIADVAGVDSTGRMPAGEAALGGRSGPVPGDSTIVVAAAKRGDVVRIEVRGPFNGGDPVHEPIVRGIVRQHGGLMQTHEVPGGGPGAGGSAYVLELPVAGDGVSPDSTSEDGATAGADAPTGNETTVMPVPAARARGTQGNAADTGAAGGGQGPDDEGHEGGEGPSGGDGGPGGSGGSGAPLGGGGAGTGLAVPEQTGGAQPTGRRRARHSGTEQGALPGGQEAGVQQAGVPRGVVSDGAQGATGPGAVDGGPGARPGQGDAAQGAQGGPVTDGRGCRPVWRGPRPYRRRDGAGPGRALRRAADCPRFPLGRARLRSGRTGPRRDRRAKRRRAGHRRARDRPPVRKGPRRRRPTGRRRCRPPPRRPGGRARRFQVRARLRGRLRRRAGRMFRGRPRAPARHRPRVPRGSRPSRRVADGRAGRWPRHPSGPPRVSGTGQPRPPGRSSRRVRVPPSRCRPQPRTGPQSRRCRRCPRPPTRCPRSRPVRRRPPVRDAAGRVGRWPGARDGGSRRSGGVGAGRSERRAARRPERVHARRTARPRARRGRQLRCAARRVGRRADRQTAGPAGRGRERAAAAMADAESSGTFVAGPEGLVAQPTEPSEPAEATGTAGGTAPGIAPAPEAGPAQAPAAPQPSPAPVAPQEPQSPQAPQAPTGRRRGRPSPAEEAAGPPPVPPQGAPAAAAHRQPLPPAAEDDGHAAGHSQGRAFSVRTLGQGCRSPSRSPISSARRCRPAAPRRAVRPPVRAAAVSSPRRRRTGVRRAPSPRRPRRPRTPVPRSPSRRPRTGRSPRRSRSRSRI